MKGLATVPFVPSSTFESGFVFLSHNNQVITFPGTSTYTMRVQSYDYTSISITQVSDRSNRTTAAESIIREWTRVTGDKRLSEKTGVLLYRYS